jgi:hypothetical protein
MNDKTTLIIKCIDFYISSITENNTKCPTIEQMKEIVKLDEIKGSLTKDKTS